MKVLLSATLMLLVASGAFADPLRCNLSQYAASTGLTAVVQQDVLTVTWAGDAGSELRARYVIENGTPLVRELAIRKGGGAWTTLGQNLVPEFRVTSGVRRMSYQQVQPLRDMDVEITQDIVDREKWAVFWDAPLVVPGVPVPQPGQAARPPSTQPLVLGQPQVGRNIGLPRKPEEIRHAAASFQSSSCDVKTDGARLEVNFPGLSMGIFAGSLRFTMYRGTRMFRLEAIAKTDEPSVAYKYEAGLKGFSTSMTPRVVWRDTGGDPQHYAFGGLVNEKVVGVKARHRILIAEGKTGSLATFTPPHTFFFTREVDTNLGYVWYRKDGDASFGIGIRQARRRRESAVRRELRALQRASGHVAADGGVFPTPVPTRLSRLASRCWRSRTAIASSRSPATRPGEPLPSALHRTAARVRRRSTCVSGRGGDEGARLNIVGLSDFHGDLRGNDTGLGRFTDQKDYGTASAKASDKDFLVTPWEEPSAYFGGHYNILFPKNVYWTQACATPDSRSLRT